MKMTKQEFQRAYAIAVDFDQSMLGVDISHFDKFAMPDFKPVHTTTVQLAALIRWQAVNIGHGKDEPGPGIDAQALNEIRKAGRRKFIVVD
jgi:hypothetical protein